MRNATAQTTANQTSCRTAWGTARDTGCVYDGHLPSEMSYSNRPPAGAARIGESPALPFPLLRKEL